VTAGLYPRKRIEAQRVEQNISSSHRIIWLTSMARPLDCGPAPSRFCDGVSGYGVIYAAPQFDTAFIETVVRDRFVHRHRRAVPFGDISERGWVELATRTNEAVVLLDLTGRGCLALGAPTDAVTARNHAAGRALGRAIYREHEDIDGFLYSSRLTGADCYAIFDRAVPRLAALGTGELKDHAALAGVLRDQHIGLIRD